LFAGVDLNGSAITQDKDETRLLYGKFVPFSDILDGKVEPTASSEAFLAAVRKYSAQSKSSKNQEVPGTLSAAK
jgi:lipid-binding SYLF domain-containing protein